MGRKVSSTFIWPDTAHDPCLLLEYADALADHSGIIQRIEPRIIEE
jgi:hypothetical protein